MPWSSLRKTPLWCCTHSVSGAPAHCTMRCGSWMAGSKRRSGGMYSANMPSQVTRQLSPSSSLRQTPPQETATRRQRESRGSTQTEWMPGTS